MVVLLVIGKKELGFGDRKTQKSPVFKAGRGRLKLRDSRAEGGDLRPEG